MYFRKMDYDCVARGHTALGMAIVAMYPCHATVVFLNEDKFDALFFPYKQCVNKAVAPGNQKPNLTNK